MDEVNKLLVANFIREVYYPEWLANVVSQESKWEMENVRRFHRLKPSLPKRQLPLTQD